MDDALAILDPGMQSTLQDFGRYGLQRFGISAAGALDPLSMQIANALVGNEAGEGVVEFTLSGGTYRVDADQCRIALAGADMPLLIDGEPAEGYRSYDLARGSQFSVGFARSGMRAYLAVAGGFAVVPVLGSLSTHLRSGLGGIDGGPLRAGGLLPLRRAASKDPLLMLRPDYVPRWSDTVRVLLGPQEHAFTSAGLETFLSSDYQVSSRTDRMGCQLEGPHIAHRDGFNIVSDGIVNGSIQVPGSGMPIILLADRQSTGGYPKIATVISADLAFVGQRRIGETLRFQAITEEEAERASIAFEETRARILALIELAGTGTLSTETLMRLNLIGGVVSAEDGRE